MWQKIIKMCGYYKLSFVFDVKSTNAYLTSFWFATITQPLWVLMQMLMIETIYGQTEIFLGYSRYDSYVLLGTFKIVQSLVEGLFMERLQDLGAKIRGTSNWSLDMMLLKPIDSQVFVTTGKFWFGAISSLMAGTGMVWYGLKNGIHMIALWQVIGYLIAVCLGIILLYIIFLFIQTWLFWFEYLQAGEDLWFATHDFGRFPRAMYIGWIGIFLNILIPITLMASVPTELLFGRMEWWNLGWLTVVVAILFYLTRQFWQYSIKKYSSFSS